MRLFVMPFPQILAIVAFVFSASIAVFANKELVWPIKEDIILTSGFMEDRNFRYHAGIDLRTWGRELQIYASEDGHVTRVNVSPWGYGKAVYIQGNSGKIYVYAHCSRFIPEIDALVRSTQIKKSRYRVDFQIEPEKIPIRKGQLIGYAGATGAGPPHLHFEIRDNHNRPLNPSNLGFSVFDNHQPIIASVSVFPIDDTTFIGGCKNIKTIDFSASVDTVYIRGRAGLSVLTWDLTSLNLDARVSVYDYRLYLNDSLVFHRKYDWFSYSDVKYIRYSKNYSIPGSGPKRAGNLFVYELNKASFYSNTQMNYPNGIIDSNDLAEGVTARIVVRDHSGNKREASLFLKEDLNTPKIKLTMLEAPTEKNLPPDTSAVFALPKFQYDSKKLEFDGKSIFIPENYFKDSSNLFLDSTGITFFFLFNSVVVSFANHSPEYLVLLNEKGAFNLQRRQNRKNEFIMPYYAIGHINRFLMLRQTVFGALCDGIFKRVFYRISADTSFLIQLDERHSIEIKKNMVNRRESYFVIEEKNIVFDRGRFKGDENFRSFFVRGRAVDFNSGFTFRYKLESDTGNHYSLYTSGSKPRYVGGDLRGGYITTSMNMNTALFHIRDIVNPVVEIIGVKQGMFYSTRPRLSATVRDDESGIWSDTQIVTKVNSGLVINEYDPSSHRTRVIHPNRIVPGRNIFSVTVTDNQGNTTTRQVEFYYKNR